MGIKPNDNKKIKNKADNINEIDDSKYDAYPNISNIVSSTELTGLMYRPPQNDEELESYKDLSTMPLPKKQENKIKK